MAREFTIIAVDKGERITRKAGVKLLGWFSGYTRNNALQGGYTYANGTKVEEKAVSWTVATSDDFLMIQVIVSEFAKMYCEMAEQECIYFKSMAGECYLVDKDGVHGEIK